jgi:23S rRNA (guanine745-N1)-methyltransferase
MLSDVAGLLTCPACGSDFQPPASALRCANGHSFDIARQGYVNLLPGGAKPGTADTADMVQARHAFLSAGHFAPLARLIADLAASSAPEGGCVLDAGAGTGYYLRAVLDRLPAIEPGPVGLAMDISARALRRAARAHPRIGAVVWDVWQPLPVRSSGISVILNVFAPRNGPEFRRVLKNDGALIVVTAAQGHLAELVQGAGLLTVDERKEDRLAATLGRHFTVGHRDDHAISLSLSHADAAALAAMGPAASHVPPEELRRRVAALPEPVTVTAAFRGAIYHPIPMS